MDFMFARRSDSQPGGDWSYIFGGKFAGPGGHSSFDQPRGEQGATNSPSLQAFLLHVPGIKGR